MTNGLSLSWAMEVSQEAPCAMAYRWGQPVWLLEGRDKRRVGVAEGLQHGHLPWVEADLDVSSGGNVQCRRSNHVVTDALGQPAGEIAQRAKEFLAVPA